MRNDQLLEKRLELQNRKADLQFQLDSVAAELRSVEAEIGVTGQKNEGITTTQFASHGGFIRP